MYDHVMLKTFPNFAFIEKRRVQQTVVMVSGGDMCIELTKILTLLCDGMAHGIRVEECMLNTY